MLPLRRATLTSWALCSWWAEISVWGLLLYTEANSRTSLSTPNRFNQKINVFLFPFPSFSTPFLPLLVILDRGDKECIHRKSEHLSSSHLALQTKLTFDGHFRVTAPCKTYPTYDFTWSPQPPSDVRYFFETHFSDGQAEIPKELESRALVPSHHITVSPKHMQGALLSLFPCLPRMPTLDYQAQSAGHQGCGANESGLVLSRSFIIKIC